MHNRPEISVVMSVYNGAKYLKDSLESILNQKNVVFEIIIINDGCTDGSSKILEDYAALDNRIKLILQENTGLTQALIRGCKEAKGKFIARIDVGDVMVSNRLKKQLQILEKHPNCRFVSCHTEFCGPQWERLWISKPIFTIDSPVSDITNDPKDRSKPYIPHHGSVMFSKSTYESVGGYRKEFYYGQDWDLWYRLSEIGKFFIVPEVLYKVRIFPECISMTKNFYQNAIAECSKGAFIARQYNEDEQPWIERAKLFSPNKIKLAKNSNQKLNKEPGLYFIGEALRRNSDLRCRPYFFSAIKHSPLRIRSYIRLFQSLSLLNQQ